jgi:hypothetical protein
MARDGGELSATETLERELSHADHLGVLGGIWDDLTRSEQRTRFEQALRSALPAGLARQALDDPACTWLWRSLREAECAGLDGGQVLRRAVAARSMAGARDVVRVLDARIRRVLDGVLPHPPERWAERVPDTGSAEMNRYLAELAEAMDDRVRRLGEHTAQTQPLWAQQAFGPLPSGLLARAGWEQRASVVAAYREQYGYSHPADPIGPEPSKTSPEQRAAWHAVLNALGRINGIDVRGYSDGDLWLRRAAYERETAWAPPHVAEHLRLMRLAERDAHVNAVRAEHEARAAHGGQGIVQHLRVARIWRALEAKAAQEAELYAATQETRRQWETVTETTRRIAIVADTELRRRHPDLPLAPLRPHPAETALPRLPMPTAPTGQKDTWIQPTLDGKDHLPRHADRGPQRSEAVTVRQQQADGQLGLGLTPATAFDQIPEQVLRIRDNAKAAGAKLDHLAATPPSSRTEDRLAPGRAREAVLRPPQPDVVPSAQVLQRHRAAKTDTGRAEPERE